MNVGEVRVITLAAAQNGLTIPATLGDAVYTVILANTAVNSGGAQRSYALSADWLSAGRPPVSGDVLSSGAARSRLVAPRVPSVAFEARLRELERRTLSRRAVGGVGAMTARNSEPPVRRDVPAVGATLAIKVLTPAAFNGKGDICGSTSYVNTTGRVMAVGTHAIVVSDVNSPAGGFTTADFQELANEFDTVTYPTDSSYFGKPTDIDRNGHVIIYYTPAVNDMTPAGQADVSGYVGGFFFAGDLYPPTASPGCYSSNQGEIFYLLAPDPAGTHGNAYSAAFVRQVTRGTLAHELQHMINSGNRYVAGSNVPFEVTWLDEGLAHFAEDAVGRARAGIGDLQTVDSTTLKSIPDSVVRAFFRQNLIRTASYVDAPDTAGPIASNAKAAANLATRGATWAFLRYTADWFSGSSPRALTRRLAAGPDTGTVNLVKAAGAPMDTLLAHWLVTMATDHGGIADLITSPPSIPGLPAQYNYRSYDLPGAIQFETNGPGYPLATIVQSGGAVTAVQVAGSGGAYFVTRPASGTARTLRFTGPGGAAPSDPGGVMRIYVVRLR